MIEGMVPWLIFGQFHFDIFGAMFFPKEDDIRWLGTLKCYSAFAHVLLRKRLPRII